MTPGQQAVMLLIGNASGRMPDWFECLVGYDVDLASLVVAGSLLHADGCYLMTASGERALADSLAEA